MSHHEITNFRNALYNLSGNRKDVMMNLLDALSGHGHEYKSVVQLSLTDCFERQYSSITEAITMGAANIDWLGVRRLIHEAIIKDAKPNVFLIDATNYSRPFSVALTDKSVVHAPNPAPGNKPIAVGHQYSTVALLPSDQPSRQKHWLIPMDISRVPSIKKGNEFGMEQLTNMICELNISDVLNISVGDSLYSSENCRVEASTEENLVHIFRLNSKRNLYRAATENEQNKNGRPKIFSSKMSLNKPDTHLEPIQHIETNMANVSGKNYQLFLDDWSDMIVRGSKKYQAQDHPIRLIRVQLNDEEGHSVFKRPLWIGVSGKKRHEVALSDVYDYYRCRYDIEHYYRFQKHRLMMTSYQTPETEHEELWCKLCLLAYIQLYLAKSVAEKTPLPWEKYLPEFKTDRANELATPSQTQRNFAKLLSVIGTPALPCIPRGRNAGRKYGNIQNKRARQPVKFKGKKNQKSSKSKSENKHAKLNPEKLDDLLQLVKDNLQKLDCLPQDFAKLLL